MPNGATMNIFNKFGQDITSSLSDLGRQIIGDFRNEYEVSLMPTISRQMYETVGANTVRGREFYYHPERSIPYHPLAIFVPNREVIHKIQITGVPTTPILSGFESTHQTYTQSYLDLSKQFRVISLYRYSNIYDVSDDLIDYNQAYNKALQDINEAQRLWIHDPSIRNLALRYHFVHRVYLPFSNVGQIKFTPTYYENENVVKMITTANFSLTPSAIPSLVAHAIIFGENRYGLTRDDFIKLFKIYDYGNNDITGQIYDELSKLANPPPPQPGQKPSEFDELNYHNLFRRSKDGSWIPDSAVYEIYMPHAGGFDSNPGKDFLIWTGSLQIYGATSAPLRFIHVLHNEQMSRLNPMYNALADYTLVRNGLFDFVRMIATTTALRQYRSPETIAPITSNIELLKAIYKAYLLGLSESIEPKIIEAIKSGNPKAINDQINAKVADLSRVLSPYQLSLIDKTALEMAKVTRPMIETAAKYGNEFLSFNPDKLFHENLYLANLDRNTNTFHTIVLRLPGVAHDNYKRQLFDSAISDASYATLQAVYTHDYWQKLLSSSATVIGIGVLGASAATIIYLLWRKYKFNKEQEKIIKDYAKAQQTATIKMSHYKQSQPAGGDPSSALANRRMASTLSYVPSAYHRDVSLLEIQPRAGLPHYAYPRMPMFGTRISFMIPWLNRFQTGDSLFMYNMLSANHAYRDENAGRVAGIGPSLNVNARFAGYPTTKTFTVAYLDSPLDISRLLINNFNWGFHAAIIGSLLLSTTVLPKIINKIIDEIYNMKEKAEVAKSKKKLDKEISFLLKQYSKNIEKYAQSPSIAQPGLTSTWGLLKGLGFQTIHSLLDWVITPTVHFLSFIPWSELLSLGSIVLASIGVLGAGVGLLVGMKVLPLANKSQDVSKLKHFIRKNYEGSLSALGAMNQMGITISSDFLSKLRTARLEALKKKKLLDKSVLPSSALQQLVSLDESTISKDKSDKKKEKGSTIVGEKGDVTTNDEDQTVTI
jgi:hypothetical protein